MPVIGVSYDGQHLKGLLEKGSVKVSMKVDVIVERGEGEHVVGILKGRRRSDEYIFSFSTPWYNGGDKNPIFIVVPVLDITHLYVRE